jgi:hypothetical protein
MLPVAPVELAEFLLSASQADLQAFDLAEPAFALTKILRKLCGENMSGSPSPPVRPVGHLWHLKLVVPAND